MIYKDTKNRAKIRANKNRKIEQSKPPPVLIKKNDGSIVKINELIKLNKKQAKQVNTAIILGCLLIVIQTFGFIPIGVFRLYISTILLFCMFLLMGLITAFYFFQFFRVCNRTIAIQKGLAGLFFLMCTGFSLYEFANLAGNILYYHQGTVYATEGIITALDHGKYMVSIDVGTDRFIMTDGAAPYCQYGDYVWLQYLPNQSYVIDMQVQN